MSNPDYGPVYAKWRCEIRDRAINLQDSGGSVQVPLGEALKLLPVADIAEVIEQACLNFVSSVRGVGLPRKSDVVEPNIEYLVFYNQDDIAGPRKAAVLAALSAGTLVGTGYDSRPPVDADRVTIPADRWGGLSVDFMRSRATSDGFSISDILVDASTEVVTARGQPNARWMSAGPTSQDTAEAFPSSIVRRPADASMSPKIILECLIQRLEPEVGHLTMADCRYRPGESLAANGRPHLATALRTAKQALDSGDCDKIAQAALICPTFERTGRAMWITQIKAAMRRKGGATRGADQTARQVAVWKPYVDRYNGLLSRGLPQAKARHLVKLEIEKDHMSGAFLPDRLVPTDRTIRKWLQKKLMERS